MSGVLTLVAAATLGQYATINLDINGLTDVSVNHAACDNTLTANWTANLATGAVCSDLQFWLTATDCGDAPAGGDVKLPSVSQVSFLAQRVQQGMLAIDVAGLPSFTGADAGSGTVCGATGLDFTDHLCASVSIDSSGFCGPYKAVNRQVAPVNIHYDEQGPSKPSITNVQPLDSAVSLTVSVSSDTDSVQVQMQGPADADFVNAAKVSGSATVANVNNLTNGTAYTFRAIAYDLAGNPSDVSDTVTATPRKSNGFWDACREAGCSASQGCSAAGDSLILAGLGMLALLRRGRR